MAVLPPLEKLREAIDCDFATGIMTWKKRPRDHFISRKECLRWNARHAGKPAFASIDTRGYFSGKVFSHQYLAHRILWLLYTGSRPKGEIDHINGSKLDNRISNLRDVSRLENQHNRRLQKKNTSGCHDVRWRPETNKWHARITFDGRRHHLGAFYNKSDAVDARKAAEQRFGFHKNHGRAGDTGVTL